MELLQGEAHLSVYRGREEETPDGKEVGESGDEAQGHEVKMAGWGEWNLVTNTNHLPLVPPIAGRGRKVSSSCFVDSGISNKTKDSRKDPGATEDLRLLPVNVLAAVPGLSRSTHSVLVKGRVWSLDAWDST